MKRKSKKILICFLTGILSVCIYFLDNEIVNEEKKQVDYNFTYGNFHFKEEATDYTPDKTKICFVVDDKTTRQGNVLTSYRYFYDQGIYLNEDGMESIGLYSARVVEKDSILIVQFMGYTDRGNAEINIHCVGSDKKVKINEIPKMYYLAYKTNKNKKVGDFVISMEGVDSTINICTLVAVKYDKQYSEEEILIGEYLYKQ